MTTSTSGRPAPLPARSASSPASSTSPAEPRSSAAASSSAGRGSAAGGEGPGQAAGQVGGGLPAGPQRRHHQPPLGHPGQPGQQPGVQQRGLAAARRADHGHHPARPALQGRGQQLHQPVRSPAGGRRTPRRPPAANGTRPGYGDRCGSQAKESAGSSPAERSPASSRANPASASVRSIHCTSASSGNRHPRLQPQRKHRPAQRPGQAQLGETPPGGHRRLAGQEDHRVGAAQLGVQLPLPVAPGGNALLGIEVDEQRGESRGPQPRHHPLGDRPVPAAVADEHRGHRPRPFAGASSRSPRRWTARRPRGANS